MASSGVNHDGRYALRSEKGQASGHASLDGSSKVPVAQLPSLVVTDTFPAASEAAMLALAAEAGDVAIRSDTGRTYILAQAPAATLANWKEILPVSWMRRARVTTGSIVGLASATITVTWPQAFPDANYTVTVSLEGTSTGAGLRILRILSKTATEITVRVINDDATSKTATIHAIAIPD